MASTETVVVTVHGIRTFGHWQPRLEALLRAVDPDVFVSHFVFGYFSILAFLVPPLRWLVTRRFRIALQRVLRSHPSAAIHLVGHSFGTHLIGWAVKALADEAQGRIHTVILAGSVLRPDFDWWALRERGLVKRVVNDCGINDSVLVLNQVCVLFTGMAGRLGFKGMTDAGFMNRYFRGGHSLYFQKDGLPSEDFMRMYWVPLLTRDEPITAVDQRAAPTALEGLMTTVLQNMDAVKMAAYSLLLLAPAVVYASLYAEANRQRDRADSESRRSAQRAEQIAAMRDEALDTIEWVFNRTANIPFDKAGFEEPTAQLVSGLLERLKRTGFEGRIVFSAHLGNFIRIDHADGTTELATGERLRHLRPGDSVGSMSAEYAIAVGQRFSEMTKRTAVKLGFPENRIDTISFGEERAIGEHLPERKDVDEWNRIAALNNRVEIQLIQSSARPATVPSAVGK